MGGGAPAALITEPGGSDGEKRASGQNTAMTSLRGEPGRVAVQIAVCGPQHCTAEQERDAYLVGQLLAERGAVVVCGGGGGVMGGVAAGARSRDGVVVGILPGPDRRGASPDLSVAVMTNLGEARNAVIVRSADAVIAVGGSWGTLSEIALAVRYGDVPVVALGGWRVVDRSGAVVPGVDMVTSAEEAVEVALGAAVGDQRS